MKEQARSGEVLGITDEGAAGPHAASTGVLAALRRGPPDPSASRWLRPPRTFPSAGSTRQRRRQRVSSLRPHTPGLTNTYGTPVGGGAMRACGHAVVRTGRGVRVFRNEGIRLQPSPLITRGPTSADTMLARITWLIGRSCRCPTDARWQAVKASTFLVARARATSRG